jgi:hypothetical protein
LAAEHRTLDINGKAASVFALRQPDGAAGVLLGPDQRFAVTVTNHTNEPTIIHWHGQTPPARQDGVANTGLETLIVPGASRGYDFVPRSGTHWMHSHQWLQEQLLMAAPLIARTPEDVRADAQEVVVLLQDFTFRDPNEILAGLTKSTATAVVSGAGPDRAMAGMDIRSGHMEGMQMGHQFMSGMRMDGLASRSSMATLSGTGTPKTAWAWTSTTSTLTPTSPMIGRSPIR